MLLLEAGRVLCPETGRDEVGDVLVEDGRIVAIGPGLAAPAEAVRVDCAGAVISPAFTDLWAHLCDPGDAARETLESGSSAAAAGGFARVLASPDTDPIVDNAVVAQDVARRGAAARGAQVVAAGALTVGLRGEELAEIGLLADAGCAALSDGGRGMGDAVVMRRALEYARPFGLPVLLRPTEPLLETDGTMHEGAVSLRVGLRGLPALAEELGVARIIGLARLTGAAVHLTHVTTARALDLVGRAKDEGVSVTASAPARSLMLTDAAIEARAYDPNLRLLPPLRPEEDRLAMLDALRSGVLDALISDHLPWTRADKELEFAWAQPGASGLETAALAAFTAFQGDARALVQALSIGPARVLGRAAALGVGSAADIVVFADTPPETLGATLRNEPLAGCSLRGSVRATVVGGRLAYVASGLGGDTAASR
jgi:dihydroorotase